MQISSIKAINFKSFGDDGLNFSPTTGLNIIVGENNSGKSNILRTIRIPVDYFKDKNKYLNDGFKGEKDEIKLELKFTLDDLEIEYLLKKLKIVKSGKNEDRLRYFRNIVFIIDSKQKDIEILFDKYRISRYDDNSQNYYLSSYDKINTSGRTLMNWSVLVQKADADTNLGKLIDEHDQTIANRTRTGHNNEQITLIMMDLPFHEIITELINSKIILFPEFRTRPQDTLTEDLIAADGSKLSSFLYNLKNGGIGRARTYKKIQDKFSELFPYVSFDVKKDVPILFFFYKSDEYEVNHNSIGAGIIETLLVISHLIFYEGSIFLIDEPEIHLHPHAVRNISRIIFESSIKNQIICSTHSSKIIDLKSGLKEYESNKGKLIQPGLNESITLIRKDRDRSIVKQIKFKELTQYDLRYLCGLDYDENYKEIFFSRLVILVEGDTEVGSLPIFADRLEKNFDSLGISIVGVGGNNFVNHIKVLSLLNIPYMIMCDQDTLKNIESDYKISVNSNEAQTSFLLLQLNKLNLLDDKELEIIKECDNLITFKEVEKCDKENCVKKKVRKGFYNGMAIRKLSPIAQNHSFFVLSSDFEHVIKKPTLYKEAEKEFAKSKRLQGVYVAQKMKKVPREFIDFIKMVDDKIIEITKSI